MERDVDEIRICFEVSVNSNCYEMKEREELRMTPSFFFFSEPLVIMVGSLKEGAGL